MLENADPMLTEKIIAAKAIRIIGARMRPKSPPRQPPPPYP